MSNQGPIRTCLGCGAKRPKGELLRLAADRDGVLAIDPDGRLAGRGAYCCNAACLGRTLRRRKKLSWALRREIEALSEELKAYPGVNNG